MEFIMTELVKRVIRELPEIETDHIWDVIEVTVLIIMFVTTTIAVAPVI